MRRKRHEERSRITALQEIELFAGCTDAELRVIDSIGAEVVFRPGRKLTCEGSGGLEFMVIVAGEARVTRDGEELAALGRGAFFGEMSLLAGAPRAATVVASTPMRCLVMHAGEFTKLLEIPSLNARILQSAAERTVIRPQFKRKKRRIHAASPHGIPA